MPFGSRVNNVAVICFSSFFAFSAILGIIGAWASNKEVIRKTHSNQDVIIRQNEQLIAEHAKMISEHRDMLLILHGLERRYLSGVGK